MKRGRFDNLTYALLQMTNIHWDQSFGWRNGSPLVMKEQSTIVYSPRFHYVSDSPIGISRTFVIRHPFPGRAKSPRADHVRSLTIPH